jgi:hypothetical protein
LRRTLGAGRHTLVVTYVDGASRTFEINIDGADRSVTTTGESSINIVAAIIMLSSMALLYGSRRLRREDEE